MRCTLSVRLSVCLSVCPSVSPSRYHSVTSRHLANYNDALRAAYRTAISAAQILVLL